MITVRGIESSGLTPPEKPAAAGRPATTSFAAASARSTCRFSPPCRAAILALYALLALTPRLARAGAEPLYVDSAHVMARAHRGELFVRARAVAIDTRHGEVIVANTGLGRIEYFDYRTWPLGFFTHEVPGRDGEPVVGEPVGLALAASGELLVTDLKAPFVDVVDFRGRTLRQFPLPSPDDTASDDRGPGAIAVAPDGRVFVASRGAGRVHVFDASFRPLSSWGVTGRDSGQLAAITALAVDSAGRVYVACASGELGVQVFDEAGHFAFGFGRHDIGPGNFSRPSGIAFTVGGHVCVSDAIRHVVQVFDSGGTLVGSVGGPGIRPGEFLEPSALAGDGHGLVALAEKSGGRFQVMWLR